MASAEQVNDRPEDDDVLVFLATLGAALGAIGETVDAVETRLAVIARSYGLRDARFSAFPTFLLLTLGQGKAATVEPTTRLSPTPRLDQIAAVHELADDAEHGEVAPRAGIERLEAIRRMENRFGDVSSVVGYAILTAGLALILRPAARDVACAAALGALVGVLRRLGSGRRALETLMPFLAATVVAAMFGLVALATLTPLSRIGWGWLTTLGALTYPLYVVHEYWGWYVIHLLHDRLTPALTVLAAAAFSIALASAIHRFVERPLGPRLRRWTAEGLSGVAEPVRARRRAVPEGTQR